MTSSAVNPERERARINYSSAELTPVERWVWALLADGLSNDDIAAAMNSRRKRVEHYINSLYSKLDISHCPPSSKRVRAALMYHGLDCWERGL